MTPTRGRRSGSIPLPAALVVVLSLFMAACGQDEPVAFAGFERSPAPAVDERELPAVEADGTETPFRFRAADGEVLLVYFGYTSCPDVCPTTLSDVRRASDNIGEEAERLDLAMVTIDPEIDTPEVLNGYVRSFLPEATAVRTTDDEALRPVADAFGADYGTLIQEGEEQVFHTGSLYAVDDQGLLILTWPFGVTVGDLERDLARLLDQAAGGAA